LKGYNFKLDKVLNYKGNIENIKKNQYGVLNQKLVNEEEKLINFNSYKNNLLIKKNECFKGTKVSNLRLINSVLDDISNNIKIQEKVISNIRNDLEKAKEELLIAAQEKKAFEKLKENDYEDYILAVKKEEEKIVDGIITFNNSSQR